MTDFENDQSRIGRLIRWMRLHEKRICAMAALTILSLIYERTGHQDWAVVYAAAVVVLYGTWPAKTNQGPSA